MKCPFCGYEENKVIDSRPRFTTYEYVEKSVVNIIKSDGKREEFTREKLKQSITIACRKRPISDEEIENVVDEIVSKMYMQDSNEIESKWIGEMVMEKLKSIDKVAYIRFASVYRNFQDIGEFVKEFEIIRKKGTKEQ
jgi:transcriptional repressor NrdR